MMDDDTARQLIEAWDRLAIRGAANLGHHQGILSGLSDGGSMVVDRDAWQDFTAVIAEIRQRDNAINYSGPDSSVECSYGPCTNRLRQSDVGGLQWCSKEHREASHYGDVR